MTPTEHPGGSIPKFDTLFADPRHYRADCRLVVTAIRRGWMAKAPQADRDALAKRFEQVTTERWATDPDSRNVRAFFAECAVLLAMDRDNTNLAIRALRYAWAREPTERSTGRPRERWHVSDYPNRIDANELRRRAKARGTDLQTLQAIDVRSADKPGDDGERVVLVVLPDPQYVWRVWLVCPRCKRRRVHLYPTRGGIRCRKCAGIAYSES